MPIELTKIFFMDSLVVFGAKDDNVYIIHGDRSYLLTSNILEPCLYVESSDKKTKILHHAFTVDKLCELAQTRGILKLVSGNEYNAKGLITIILRAMELPQDDMDIDYAEGFLYMDRMKIMGAVSEETAVESERLGLHDNRSMQKFIHCKKVGETADGRLYLRNQES